MVSDLYYVSNDVILNILLPFSQKMPFSQNNFTLTSSISLKLSGIIIS